MSLRYRMHGNLVAVVPQFLHVSVIGVGVRHEERRFDRTSVGIGALRREQMARVDVPVFMVYRAVERQGDHLWCLKIIEQKSVSPLIRHFKEK